ncbi:MAG TPA: hypothetical protein VFB67_00255 [Candidatus Polarisedimenticolaceae bacterium]|nr:hypothetical protein [Candidatus Polarisedimenticolaceae bacterium]
MSQPKGIRVIVGVLALALAGAGACGAEPPIAPEHMVIALTPADKQAALDFEARLKDYLALHRKLEATLPNLPKDATPEQLDKNQRQLGKLIQAERAGSKRGEFFTPGMQSLVRRTLNAVLAGPDGKTIKASIMDENPGVPNLSVNDRYPDSIPLSTMPPQVLEPLPKLEEDIEYRFIGKRLALVDAHAHIIVDFTEDVLR